MQLQHVPEEDFISDEERATVRAYADKTRERGLEHVKVITAAINVIRQQRDEDD